MSFYNIFTDDPTLICGSVIKDEIAKYSELFRQLVLKSYKEGKLKHCGIYYILLHISLNVNDISSEAIAFVTELICRKNIICPPVDGYDIEPSCSEPIMIWRRTELDILGDINSFLNAGCFGMSEETMSYVESGRNNPIDDAKEYNISFRDFIRFCCGSAPLSHYGRKIESN